MKKTILIVDDSPFSQRYIQKSLEKSKEFKVVGKAGDGEEAKKLFKEQLPEIITLDNILPDILGVQLIPFFKKHNADVKVLVVSAIQQQSVKKEASDLGADGYLCKPFTEEELVEAIQNLYEA